MRVLPSSSQSSRQCILPSLSTLLLALNLSLLLLTQIADAICYNIRVFPSVQPDPSDVRYQITTAGQTETINFNFDHDPKTGGNCATLIRTYSVTVNGGVVPSWMTMHYSNDNSAPWITVATTDDLVANIYTVVITASVNTNPVTYAQENIRFTIALDPH